MFDEANAVLARIVPRVDGFTITLFKAPEHFEAATIDAPLRPWVRGYVAPPQDNDAAVLHDFERILDTVTVR